LNCHNKSKYRVLPRTVRFNITSSGNAADAPDVAKKFCTQYRNEPPSRSTIYSWHKQFVETGCSVRHAKLCKARLSIFQQQKQNARNRFNAVPDLRLHTSSIRQSIRRILGWILTLFQYLINVISTTLVIRRRIERELHDESG
jgi:hypothetical protein